MIRLALAALALAGCGHCAPTQTKPPCTAAVIEVAEHEPTPCDLTPPQRLDITGTTDRLCADMGGVFVAPDRCEGVDY